MSGHLDHLRTALLTPGIPFAYRWRLLLLQPLHALSYLLHRLPYIFTPRTYSTLNIPNRHGAALHTLVYHPSRSSSSPPQLQTQNQGDNKLRPLHISLHSGAFVGGFPEAQRRWNERVCEQTGAVVVAPSYRLAPRWRFPAAIDDVDDVVAFCIANAERLWGADPRMITVDGFSAGGNLAYALCQAEGGCGEGQGIDLRLRPQDKPRSLGFPKRDPIGDTLASLYDAYPVLARAEHMDDPRLSPIVAPLEKLPKRIMLHVPSIDILVHEQLVFAERVKREIEERGLGGERVCEAKVLEGTFHGWLELPFMPKKLASFREGLFDEAIAFLRETHRKGGWEWSM